MGILKISATDSPSSVALITAIENIIDEIAIDNMTPLEVLGVLDFVSKRFYEVNLGED